MQYIMTVSPLSTVSLTVLLPHTSHPSGMEIKYSCPRNTDTYPANILYRPDIGPILDSISARHRPDIDPMSDVQLGYTSGRYRLPTCSRYCADIHRLSLFLAKTPFSWLLKPSANKIGKIKRGECINFNKFIYTNKFKATFEQFWRRRCTCLYSSRNRLLGVAQCQTCLKAGSLQWGWPLWKAAHIILTLGCCLWKYWHLILRWRVQSCRKPEFHLHFFLESSIQVRMKKISISCKNVNKTK